MKAKLILIILFSIVITGCKQKEEEVVKVEEVKIDLLNDEFPEAQKK